MLDRVYPFICKQNQTLFYSWGLGLPLSTEHRFNYRALCALGKSLQISPNTLIKRFEEGALGDYLTFKRQGEHYVVLRSGVPHSYAGLPFNPALRSDLTILEIILLTAIACRDLQNKSLYTYGELAARTGYSRRQVIHQIGILSGRGYLVPCTIEEEVSVTTHKGTSNKERERDSHRLSPSFKKEYLHYLKNLTPEDIKLKPSNIINITDSGKSGFAKKQGKKTLPDSFSQRKSSQGSIPQGNRPLKEAWEVYEKTFTPGPSESLRGTETLIRQGKVKGANIDKIIKAIHKAKTISFLNVANGFGWQEAVIECYQRKALYIGTSSHHIEKFSSSKLSFAWIVGHADEILSGKYDEGSITSKQREFGERAKQFRAGINPIKERNAT